MVARIDPDLPHYWVRTLEGSLPYGRVAFVPPAGTAFSRQNSVGPDGTWATHGADRSADLVVGH